MAIRGVSGLEKIGLVLVPVTFGVLFVSVALTWHRADAVLSAQGSGDLDFSEAVSAIVGIYVVGIVIQPDYGRFVRRPLHAALGAGLALGVVFPAIMLLASFASAALGVGDLVTAMIRLGFGLPALIVLLFGAWIDSAASLYSASLSFANQLPRVKFRLIGFAVWAAGVALVVLGVESAFIPFLLALGVSLPPLATILIMSHFAVRGRAGRREAGLAGLCWAVGTIVGVATTRHLVTLTGLPVLDGVATTMLVFMLTRLAGRRLT